MATSLSKAFVILIGLSDDPLIGVGVATSLQKLEECVNDWVPAERLSLTVVRAEQCTPANIAATIRSLPIHGSDALFCYYLGHGAYGGAPPTGDPSGGRYFILPLGNLVRRDLFNELLARGCRLTILISDACSVFGAANARFPAECRELAAWGMAPFAELVLAHSGQLDLNASARGQSAYFSDYDGGWFSNVACQVFGANGRWSEAIPKLKEQADSTYKQQCALLLANPGSTDPATLQALRDQHEMTPAVFRCDLVRD